MTTTAAKVAAQKKAPARTSAAVKYSREYKAGQAAAKKEKATNGKAAPAPRTKAVEASAVSAALESKVVKMTDEGAARPAIAEATGLSIYRIWVIQSEHGLKGGKKTLPPSMKAKKEAATKS